MLREKLANDINAAIKYKLAAGLDSAGPHMMLGKFLNANPEERKFMLKLLAGGAGLGIGAGILDNPKLIKDFTRQIFRSGEATQPIAPQEVVE